MGSIKAVASIASVTGLAEDTVVNTFAVEVPGSAAGADHAGIASAFQSFYGDVGTGMTASISSYLGPMLSRVGNSLTIDLYDIDGKLSGAPHGSPIYTEAFSIDAPAGGFPIPEEVALCVTLRGLGWADALVEVPDGVDAGTLRDRPRQRRTGRIYLGPLDSSAGNSTSGRAHPHGDFRTNVHAAVEMLVDDLQAEAGSYLAVWSKVDAALYRVTHVETDDAWDTQRRRGRAATVRSRAEVYTP